MRTVVIIAGCQSYRTGDFLAAASLLRLTSVIASDVAAPLGADALASTGAGHIEIELHDAWVWDMYRQSRFLAKVTVSTTQVVTVEELPEKDL